MPILRRIVETIRGKDSTLNVDEMDIYMDVIAHGECMPTRDELEHTNRDKTSKEIDAAVTGLIDSGIIRPVGTVDGGEYVTVYALTQYGAEKASEACTDVQSMRDDYEAQDRTEEILSLEWIERPPKKKVNNVYVPEKRED